MPPVTQVQDPSGQIKVNAGDLEGAGTSSNSICSARTGHNGEEGTQEIGTNKAVSPDCLVLSR